MSTTTTTTGRCAACGQPFTTALHQRPQRRFCSERCRKRDWQRHQRHRHTPQRHRAGLVARPADGVPRPGDVTDVTDVAAPPGASTARCPHCARPIAVINLLVAPAAAQVPVPGTRHG